eukprot:6636930-Pyramimonas_sp.AAC.3
MENSILLPILYGRHMSVSSPSPDPSSQDDQLIGDLLSSSIHSSFIHRTTKNCFPGVLRAP